MDERYRIDWNWCPPHLVDTKKSIRITIEDNEEGIVKWLNVLDAEVAALQAERRLHLAQIANLEARLEAASKFLSRLPQVVIK